MALHIETPLIESVPLSRASGRSVWLKMDALQPPGSFKIRGIGAACEHHAKNGKRRFVSSSGGNAGMAVAYAGRRLQVPVSVFVPQTTTERAIALIRQEGAEVIVHGAAWDEAHVRALASLDANTAFIHPFDDPLLWAGHATMIDEVVRAGLAFDAVVLSVGGGGLLSGVAEGLERNGLGDIPIVAAETEGTASFAASFKAGALVELRSVTGVATSLGARKVCARAFEISQTRPVECAVVSDAVAIDACNRFLDDHRVVVEPACGASLAVAYIHAEQLARFERVLIIACGGATATVERLQAWQG
ncbi:pyridoxal-phosphate dependent enzyme [Ensifer sp. MJa1]|uniref:pyridoxal-phosphate dependent enzyme n=1 Tax=Ensifer sp. MJa1 TaxID=2919888 RepID=UPI0030089D47